MNSIKYFVAIRTFNRIPAQMYLPPVSYISGDFCISHLRRFSSRSCPEYPQAADRKFSSGRYISHVGKTQVPYCSSFTDLVIIMRSICCKFAAAPMFAAVCQHFKTAAVHGVLQEITVVDTAFPPPGIFSLFVGKIHCNSIYCTNASQVKYQIFSSAATLSTPPASYIFIYCICTFMAWNKRRTYRPAAKGKQIPPRARAFKRPFTLIRQKHRIIRTAHITFQFAVSIKAGRRHHNSPFKPMVYTNADCTELPPVPL